MCKGLTGEMPRLPYHTCALALAKETALQPWDSPDFYNQSAKDGGRSLTRVGSIRQERKGSESKGLIPVIFVTCRAVACGQDFKGRGS